MKGAYKYEPKPAEIRQRQKRSTKEKLAANFDEDWFDFDVVNVTFWFE